MISCPNFAINPKARQYPMSKTIKNKTLLLFLVRFDITTVTFTTYSTEPWSVFWGHLGRHLEIPWVMRPLSPLYFKRWHLQVLLETPRVETDREFKVFQWYSTSRQISFGILNIEYWILTFADLQHTVNFARAALFSLLRTWTQKVGTPQWETAGQFWGLRKQ